MSRKNIKILKFKKALLNFLLSYLSPSNKIIIYLSQDLDKLISKYQKRMYIKYKKQILRSGCLRKVA